MAGGIVRAMAQLGQRAGVLVTGRLGREIDEQLEISLSLLSRSFIAAPPPNCKDSVQLHTPGYPGVSRGIGEANNGALMST